MWQEWLFYWVSPFTIALELWLAAIACFYFARRRAALALSACGFAVVLVGSLPVVASMLAGALESRQPVFDVEATPSADAIVLLGGALATGRQHGRPTFVLGQSSGRIFHAAALYRAGKAPLIVVAAGNRPDFADFQAEGDAIAALLQQMGVPPTAIRVERESRTTRENAEKVKPILRELKAGRVLLVTSAWHMPRAMRTFELVLGNSSLQIVPAGTDVLGSERPWTRPGMWLPSLEAFVSVTKSLKEFAGMAALAIIR